MPYVPPASSGALPEVIAYYRSSAGETVPNSDIKRINYGAKVLDPDNLVVTGADAWVFTAPRAGVYNMYAQISFKFAGAAGYFIGLKIYKNGARVRTRGIEHYSTSATIERTVSIYLADTLAAGDTIYFVATQTSGGNQDYSLGLDNIANHCVISGGN